MLFKEDVEQSLRNAFTNLTVDGDTIRALTELYNSLPSSEIDLPVKGMDIEIIPDKSPAIGVNLGNNIIKQKLQNLADELNEAEPIDWYNIYQTKYFINFNFTDNTLWLNATCCFKGLDIYSTDESFLKKAKERIGEARLIELLKEEYKEV